MFKKNVQRTIDYSLDTNNFFDTVQKKTLFQLAADTLLSHFRDTLDAIIIYAEGRDIALLGIGVLVVLHIHI